MVPASSEQSLSFRQRRSQRRVARRERVARRFGSVEVTTRDPLAREKAGWRRVIYIAGVAAAAVAFHVLVPLAFAAVGLVRSDGPPATPQAERVELRVVEPEPEPPKVEGPAVPDKRRARLAPPPPDPVDVRPVEPTPAPTPAPQSRRRTIVGLSFESTVSGGGGPSFAVGNTRMGSTARKAADPASAEKLEPRSLNRTATRIPGGRFTKPKRLGKVKPAYPELLRAQGVEADVVVTIAINEDGRVTDVAVIKGARPEFDSAAIEAAKEQMFAPATRDGEPVQYTLKYTYRFRLDEA